MVIILAFAVLVGSGADHGADEAADAAGGGGGGVIVHCQGPSAGTRKQGSGMSTEATMGGGAP